MVKLLPMASILALSVDEQDKLAMDVCQVARTSNSATEAHKTSFPAAGKIVYAVQKRLEELKSTTGPDGKPKKSQINLATTLAGYWESITKVSGQKSAIKLNNHWLSCAVAFGTYVDSELVSEKDYDNNPGANLELAASISTAVGHDLTDGAVTAAAEELRDRTKNSAKRLREILDSVKEPKAMTAEKAQELIAKIIASGFLTSMIAAAGAEIAHMEDTEAARNAFFGMSTATEMFAANMMTKEVGADGKPVMARRFPDETLQAWSATYAKANAPKAPEQSTSTPHTQQLEAVAA